MNKENQYAMIKDIILSIKLIETNKKKKKRLVLF